MIEKFLIYFLLIASIFYIGFAAGSVYSVFEILDLLQDNFICFAK